jgi:uncharacterized protein (DUF433 family)
MSCVCSRGSGCSLIYYLPCISSSGRTICHERLEALVCFELAGRLRAREHLALHSYLAAPTAGSDNRRVAAVIETIPLVKDSHGVFRIGGTRVTLDLVVRAFNRGATAEEILQKFPSLELSDVYQVIGYYLKHQAELCVPEGATT